MMRVGIVDDSAFNRLCLSEWVELADDLQVGSVLENGEEALRAWLLDPPDVAIVDLEMPKLDGLTLVRLLMAKRPFPMVVFSSYSSSDNVVRALEAGALRFVAKPDSLVDVDAEPLRAELLAAVREAARVDVGRLVSQRASMPSLLPSGRVPGQLASHLTVLVAGTGGPQALFELVAGLQDLPGRCWVALAHMPAKYMHSLASRLAAKTMIEVALLEPGRMLVEGTLYLADPAQHLRLRTDGEGILLRVADPTPDLLPADGLLKSMSEGWGVSTSAALLTGGGLDGVEGLRMLQTAGGTVYLQDAHEAILPELVLAAAAAGVAAPSHTLGELRQLLSKPV